VIGAMTTAIVTVATGDVVGARFHPGGASALLDVAARELRDDTVHVADLLGALGRTLVDRVAGAPDISHAIAALSATLLQLQAYARALDPRVVEATELLEHVGGELPLSAVAARLSVGERQLERLFDERVGLGPKIYARVARMRRAIRAMESRAPHAAIAFACGYTDQAHFIRDFRRLTGLTPTAYARMSKIANPPLSPIRTFAS
jgi:transcriptional regulator GlxA family with amidase domain